LILPFWIIVAFLLWFTKETRILFWSTISAIHVTLIYRCKLNYYCSVLIQQDYWMQLLLSRINIRVVHWLRCPLRLISATGFAWDALHSGLLEACGNGASSMLRPCVDCVCTKNACGCLTTSLAQRLFIWRGLTEWAGRTN